MDVRFRRTMVWLSAAGLLVACGDDGPDLLRAADEAEFQVISGGDADREGDGAMADDDHAVMDDEDHAAMDDEDHAAMDDEDHAAMDDEDHAAMDDEDHAAMDDEDHAAMDDEDHAAMDDEDHAAMDDEDHAAMDDDDHAAMDDDDHAAMDDDGPDDVVVGEEAEATHDDDPVASTDLVVEVEMVEFGYVMEPITIPVGEPVTFRFSNTGVVPHEAMFGTSHQQDEFAAAGDHGDGHGDAGHHGEVAAVTLDAGEVGDIVMEFGSPGEVWIGCHLPGHYDAGMASAFIVG